MKANREIVSLGSTKSSRKYEEEIQEIISVDSTQSSRKHEQQFEELLRWVQQKTAASMENNREITSLGSTKSSRNTCHTVAHRFACGHTARAQVLARLAI